nr:rhoptry-associated protein 1 beta1 [Babesia sp. Xinjiang]
MKAFISVFVSSFLLVARSAYAVRHYQNVTSLSPSEVIGNVSESLAAGDTVLTSQMTAREISHDMRNYLMSVREGFVDEICMQVPQDAKCAEAVSAYVSRCMSYGCLKVDSVRYPMDAEYQPLVLPNPYQLDAAFTLFRNSESNPSKNVIKRPWMRFRNGGSHGDYHNFLVSLISVSIIREPDATDVEYLVSKLLFMATLYYKTYLIVDATKAKIFNKLSFATHIFGSGIRKVLKTIVRSNVPEDVGEYSIERIRHLTGSYSDYMLTHVPQLSSFAHRYSRMVVKVVLSALTSYVDAPWYKKWFKKFKEYLAKIAIPTKDFFENKIGAPTKDFFENKIGAPTKDFFENKIGAPTKDFFENKLGPRAKDFFENKISAPTKVFFENKVGPRTKDFFENKVGAPTKDFFENKLGPQAKNFFESKVLPRAKEVLGINSPASDAETVAEESTATIVEEPKIDSETTTEDEVSQE